jgi:hypothetical protein
MENTDIATIAVLSDAELDIVAAGSSAKSLVNLNNLVSINIGVQLANQANIAVFSTAIQGGAQLLSLNQLAIGIL